MIPTLRDYQFDMVQTAVVELNKPKPKPFILQAATGAGKSLVIAGISKVMNKKVLVLQPSKELLNQNYDKMIAFGVQDVKKYSASVGQKEIGTITMATIGSIHKIAHMFQDIEIVIIDECHLVNAKDEKSMLMKFLKKLTNAKVVGLTATPYRQDTIYTRLPGGLIDATVGLKMLNRMGKTPFFTRILYKVETQDLIDRGYLTPIKYYTESTDWSRLKINSTGADFKDDENLRAFNVSKITRISQAVEYANNNGNLSLAFCGDIAQAEQVHERLQGMGIFAPVVTGTTPAKERDEIVARFKAGTIKHVLNVGVFTTGFDAPKLDTIIMSKATMSLALWYQIVGRGVRLDPDNPAKILKVYDLAGVCRRLGRVETIKVIKEKGGFRDEVWSEAGRMDGHPLYTYTIDITKKGGR